MGLRRRYLNVVLLKSSILHINHHFPGEVSALWKNKNMLSFLHWEVWEVIYNPAEITGHGYQKNQYFGYNLRCYEINIYDVSFYLVFLSFFFYLKSVGSNERVATDFVGYNKESICDDNTKRQQDHQRIKDVKDREFCIEWLMIWLYQMVSYFTRMSYIQRSSYVLLLLFTKHPLNASRLL